MHSFRVVRVCQRQLGFLVLVMVTEMKDYCEVTGIHIRYGNDNGQWTTVDHLLAPLVQVILNDLTHDVDCTSGRAICLR